MALYHTNGKINVTVVQSIDPANKLKGLYHSDGSMYDALVISNLGLNTVDTLLDPNDKINGIYAPDGSLYVTGYTS